jgi:putative Holliday junction resolvase
MTRGRRIAFDYGDSRIGVAVCDPDGILATPLPFLDSRHPKLMAHIRALFDEYQPIKIYVGEPLLLSGGSGVAVEKAKEFAKSLEQTFEIPLKFVDERLSTVSATRQLQEAGKSTRESKGLVDSMAAVSILESGLASEGQ